MIVRRTRHSLQVFLLLIVLSAAAFLPMVLWAQENSTAKAQEPKEKATRPGHAGTTVEELKLPSPAMGRDIDVVVVLPPAYAAKADQRFPVLYTLHGRGAPFGVFRDMTTVHNALREKPMIVVGFNGDRAGWYQDASKKADSKFTTFFFDTLIPSIDAHYRTVAETRGRAVTGFSMGGFGAIHYLLARPEAFASASSMSGAFEPLTVKWVKKDFGELFGEAEENPAGYAQLDLRARLKAAAKKGVKLPPVFVACGTDDGLLPQSKRMRDLLKELGFVHEYAEAPGAHNFRYWKAAATDVIDLHWRTLPPGYKPQEHGPPPVTETKAEPAKTN